MGADRMVSADEALSMRAAHAAAPPSLTPWEMHEAKDQDGLPLAWVIESPGAGVDNPARVPAEDGAEADAAYIVAAVNAHEALFETVIAQATELARLDDAARGALDDLAKVRAELAALRAAVRELAAAEEYAAEHDVNDADFGNCTFAEFSGGLDRLKTARSALDALTREPARG